MALDVEKMEVKLGVHSSFLYHHLFYSYFPRSPSVAGSAGRPAFILSYMHSLSSGLTPPTDSSCPSLSQAI